MKNIIYYNGSGISVIIPPCDCELSIEQLAIKDVPSGVPFLIVDTSSFPDRSQRNLWQADFSNPDGYGGQP